MCQRWLRELSASHLVRVLILVLDLSLPSKRALLFVGKVKGFSHHELQPNLQTNLFEGSWSGSD